MTGDLRRRAFADLALLGVTFLWGCTFVIVKDALRDSSTLLFLALRFSLGALILIVFFRRRIALNRTSLRLGGIIGVLLFVGFLCQTAGLRWTTPAKSGFLTGLYVVLVPLYAAVFYRTLPSWNSLAGVAAALAGLYLLVAPSGVWDPSRGDFLTLLCAAAFGLHILLLGHFARAAGAMNLSVIQVGVAAVLALGTCFWAEDAFIRWTPGLIAAILITGVLATAVALSVQAWAQQFTSPTHAALIFSLEPVFAWITSYVMTGEKLGWWGAAGAVLILLGILISEWKPS